MIDQELLSVRARQAKEEGRELTGDPASRWKPAPFNSKTLGFLKMKDGRSVFEVRWSAKENVNSVHCRSARQPVVPAKLDERGAKDAPGTHARENDSWAGHTIRTSSNPRQAQDRIGEDRSRGRCG